MNDPIKSSTCSNAKTQGHIAPLTLRIGMVGHMPHKLPKDWSILTDIAKDVVHAIYKSVQDIAETEEKFIYEDGKKSKTLPHSSKWLYQRKSSDENAALVDPEIRIMSAFADGADRLLIDRSVIEQQFRPKITAVFPFEYRDYQKAIEFERKETDHGDRGERTDNLDDKYLKERLGIDVNQGTNASWTSTEGHEIVALDGRLWEGTGSNGQAPERPALDRAYGHVARYIVSQNDIIIAICKENEPLLPGKFGTAYVIDRAKENGLPVIQICPDLKVSDEKKYSAIRLFLPYEEFSSEKNLTPKISSKNNPKEELNYRINNSICYQLLFTGSDFDGAVSKTNESSDDKEQKRKEIAKLAIKINERMKDLPGERFDAERGSGGKSKFVAKWPMKLEGFELRIFEWFRNFVLLNAPFKEVEKELFEKIDHADDLKLENKSHEKSMCQEEFFEHYPNTRLVFERIRAAYSNLDVPALIYSSSNRSAVVTIYLLAALAIVVASGALFGSKTYIGSPLGDAPYFIYYPSYVEECHFNGLVCLSNSEPETGYGKVKLFLSAAELIILSSIWALLIWDRSSRWHDRWIEYRGIAEVFRPLMFLSLVGQGYNFGRLRQRQRELSVLPTGEGGAERSWMFPYIETQLRWAGVAAVGMNSRYVEDCRKFVLKNWIEDQIKYHRKNAIETHILNKRLHNSSIVLFFIVFSCVLLKVVLLTCNVEALLPDAIPSYVPSYVSAWSGYFAAALPALAFGLFAIRHHSEFEISSKRSLTMHSALIIARKRLSDGKNITSSEELGQLMLSIADQTMHESADWGSIYSAKVTETA